MALGSLPGGSGNAYCQTVCDKSNEPNTIEGCTYLIAKGKTLLIDIVEYEIEIKDNNNHNNSEHSDKS